MEHVLDNPAWSALNSGNQHIAEGNERVKYFAKDIAPFIGLKDNSDDNFRELYELLPDNGPVVFISPVEREIPKQWNTLRKMICHQMIYNEPPMPQSNTGIAELDNTHVPQMLALTQLTNPGPFLNRTIEFGHYSGVLDGDKLIAMAGQRMHAFNYAEISAVCTHPDHLGRGYAKQLLLNQVQRMQAAGIVPYLHVLTSNERAIKIYESIGFAKRKVLHFYVLEKKV
jgi:predicted GNAT family acetyltransferase